MSGKLLKKRTTKQKSKALSKKDPIYMLRRELANLQGLNPCNLMMETVMGIKTSWNPSKFAF